MAELFLREYKPLTNKMMNKSKWIAAIAASVAAMSLAVGISVSDKSQEMLIRENAEVLASGEGGSYSECYNAFSGSFGKALACISCVYEEGVGVHVGGMCWN